MSDSQVVEEPKRKFSAGDWIVLPRLTCRFGTPACGKVLELAPDGTYKVEAWGLVGPGDSHVFIGVPESDMKLRKI